MFLKRFFDASPSPHATLWLQQDCGHDHRARSRYVRLPFPEARYPKAGSAPFIATRQPTYIVIIQTDSHNFGAHIMQQKIRIGVNCLTSQPWQTGTVQQHGAPRLGMQRGDMAKMALWLYRNSVLPLSPAGHSHYAVQEHQDSAYTSQHLPYLL